MDFLVINDCAALIWNRTKKNNVGIVAAIEKQCGLGAVGFGKEFFEGLGQLCMACQ